MAEGPQPLPDPEPPVLGRCSRHPAQPLAGVYSSCLAERLSSVRSPEIVEFATAHDRRQGRLRNTLMLLFQMDNDSPHSQLVLRARRGGGAARGRGG